MISLGTTIAVGVSCFVTGGIAGFLVCAVLAVRALSTDDDPHPYGDASSYNHPQVK